jgi:adenine-specific DNA-methyltransferase
VTFAALGVQNHGEVFTRRWVVEVLLDLAGYTSDRDLAGMHLLEPSCGSGAFLGPAVERLIASARRNGRDLASLGDAIRADDLQVEHVQTCRTLCRDLLVAAGESPSAAFALAESWVWHADFLLAGLLGGMGDPPEIEDRLADVVIGNPPYIRYDDLADDVVAQYRSAWPTMQGRGDIYIGFIERSLGMLRPGGRVGFICADRWMRNQYGAALRKLITSRYAVEHVWTMHAVDAFEAQVSAYPAITVLGNHVQGPAVVADTTSAFGASSAAALARAARDEEFIQFSDVGVKAHRLPHWFDSGEFWPTGSPERLALLENLNDRFGPLQDPATGTKVSIGVATGADKVYVTKDPNLAEPGRILPLAMREDLMSGTFEWQGNYLVNPWADDGSLVPLAD